MGLKLPQIPARLAIKVFESFGWRIARIKGSHHIMVKDGERANLSIPVKDKGNTPLKPGLLRALIRDANLTLGEFLNKYNSM
jgi:predicted RNA binding protein YcfA (HicA-like mRNA interferase family)